MEDEYLGHIYLYFTVYPKKELVQCKQEEYGSYSTLASARTACASDSNCEAVYDENCDNSLFTLCPVNYAEDTSTVSCLYMKNGKNKKVMIAKKVSIFVD